MQHKQGDDCILDARPALRVAAQGVESLSVSLPFSSSILAALAHTTKSQMPVRFHGSSRRGSLRHPWTLRQTAARTHTHTQMPMFAVVL